MEYSVDRVVRPPGMTTECLLVEGTIQLAGYDADLTIVFPGGQRSVRQWRVDGPTLDLCFDQPVDVFNNGPNMRPAPVISHQRALIGDVEQLVIPLRPEYTEQLPYSVGLANESGSVMGRFATEDEASGFIDTLPDHEDGRYYLDGPPDDVSEEEAKS